MSLGNVSLQRVDQALGECLSHGLGQGVALHCAAQALARRFDTPLPLRLVLLHLRGPP
ncbi:hypothetical protein [Chelatococcus sp. XZ-Ab1]|uniref:hypothetical protein n=1 Tax=Chelatococcus sp. XZ-Ab1 TaxID=3034027 RepID=UPI0023E42AD7|nr:hypothetical protein [Chelatococcus sp. XZ-Ab1]